MPLSVRPARHRAAQRLDDRARHRPRPDKRRPAPSRIDRRGRSKPRQRLIKPRKPKRVPARALEMLACDTIERIRDGMRRYIVTFIDPVSHLALAVGLPSRHARHTAPRLGLVLAAPAPPPGRCSPTAVSGAGTPTSTASSPTGSSLTTPSVRTIPSASNPR